MILTELDGAALRVGALPEHVLRLRAELEQPDVWTGPPGSQPATGLTVELHGLGKTYGARRVLDAIDLTITPGEFVVIVGRSGCGKSTLLRLVAGLEPATQGRVTLDGLPLDGHRDDARLMFQDARLLPWKSVLDNVALGLTGHDARERARAALAEVGLADRAGEWPARLSGGQRQRVALARALVHAPRLLLLDEPLGALDALTRIEMQQLIERLWRQHGCTALLVTHDVSEAIALADRVLLIEDHRIALDERIALPRPRSRGQAAFAALEARVLDRVLREPARAATPSTATARSYPNPACSSASA
ncbi:ATP-binding cassette domain-containing protein [Leptothrix discophora]|uniref:ATP-binding cassette domain-containing protein n=1 Tax=Leptothrix discophora TaxID=89 RepID=A0ABT9G408_LEPDI|nr:ATP-binding cassette domain-containing protein [Leptothrix discophora]MDP4301229.1 ATP-binding cassette domain-containing protein [Leptothrix discophora]